MKNSIFFLLFFTVGCSSLFSGFRNNVEPPENETPTVGGLFPENNFLEENGQEMGRGLASEAENRAQNSWKNQSNAYSNRMMNRPTRYSDNPQLPPQGQKLYKNGVRATGKDFVDDTMSEGSLWAPGGQTNYYFTKNQVKEAGDIISLKVGPTLLQSISTEVRKTLTEEEYELEMELAQKRLEAKAKGTAEPTLVGGRIVAADSGKPAAGAPGAAGAKPSDSAKVDVPEATPLDIDLTKTLGLKEGELMMGEILERYPNGNYKIRGVKRIPFHGGVKTVSMVGIAAAPEVEGKQEIDSGRLYEYQVNAFK